MDCNVLYSTSMSDRLPVDESMWVRVRKYLCNNDTDYGFILKVDLEYPEHLYDAHNAKTSCLREIK